MKIGIIGTRGIPNHYGGFEQFAEQVAVRWVQMGHDVVVYNSHLHPFQEKFYKGVQIVHCFDPEYKIGTAGQFIYDLNCILNSRKQKFDIFLQLGYTSSSIWSCLMPKNSVIVTNMDGLEWKRSKYSARVQSFLRKAEKWAVKSSDFLVADSIGIQDYLRKSFDADSTYIAYGSDIYSENGTSCLKDYEVSSLEFFLIIARLEPENSIELILDGYQLSDEHRPILVVGNHNTHYGHYLKNKFKSEHRVKFLGGIYQSDIINQLRANCQLYFHGHTVGGTNPSLIEAMGCGAVICAHDNVFNRSILNENGLFFRSADDIRQILSSNFSEEERASMRELNRLYVKQNFSWEKIAEDYLQLFRKALL
jgi:glycosyltransferase involved in cell wall biosynthesis